MSILIAVAHADDETLGCFSLFHESPDDVYILHATDSAPRDLQYARRAGFDTRESYAAARRAETRAMLELAGIPEDHYYCLDIADLEVPLHWRRVRDFVEVFGAARTYTHAYEGGHPDHDALALALAGLPNIWEFPLYHAFAVDPIPDLLSEAAEPAPPAPPQPASFGAGFLIGVPDRVVTLVPEHQAKKRALLDTFVSQQRVISMFPIEREPFRPMWRYDFTRPPHAGELYYERRKLGWTWPEWRKATS